MLRRGGGRCVGIRERRAEGKEFPRRNDGDEFSASMAYLRTLRYQEFRRSMMKGLDGAIGVAAMSLGVWMVWRRGAVTEDMIV
jgi:hypothetical protein